MSACSFDSNIVIDALNGREAAHATIRAVPERWISRVTWIEVLSKVGDRGWSATEAFMTQFDVDELDTEIAARAAMLRNARPKLKLADAVIFASALVHGRILITRNTHDFPETTPGVRVPYTLPI